MTTNAFDAFADRTDHHPAGPFADAHAAFGTVEHHNPNPAVGQPAGETEAPAGLPADVVASLHLPEHAQRSEHPGDAEARPDDDEIDGYRLTLRRGHWIQVAPLDVVSNKERNALQRVLTTAKADDDEPTHIALDRAFTATKSMQANLLTKLIEAWSFSIPLPANVEATDQLPAWAGRYLDDIFNKALIGLFPEFSPSLNAASPTPPSAA